MTSSPILESAIEAAQAGLSVHYQRGKGAFEPGWNSGPPKSEAQLRRDFNPQYNVGFQTGARSKIDGRPVVVLDIDIRSDDPKHLVGVEAAVRGLLGDRGPTVITGGGGRHFYFRVPEDRLPTNQATVLRQSIERVDGKPAWTIELLAAGHACTFPPSIHPETGKPYVWANGGLSHIETASDELLTAAEAAGAMKKSQSATQEDSGWSKREPINAELKPVPPFEPALLPEALRLWIMDEAERMPCPPDFIAAAAIVMISSIVGARCGVRPKSHDSWIVIPNLWGGVVGLPSSKKSPAIGAAMKPLGRLIEIAQKSHQG